MYKRQDAERLFAHDRPRGQRVVELPRDIIGGRLVARGVGLTRVGEQRFEPFLGIGGCRGQSARSLEQRARFADASDLPIVVYNVPGRTVADISAETMCKLAEIPTVVATKDASGDLARVTMHRAGVGAAFCQLSGNDDLRLPPAVLGLALIHI